MDSPFWRLRGRPDVDSDVRGRLERDFLRFATDGLPGDLVDYLRDAYRMDLVGSFADRPIKSPWGKASGQLSMTPQQIDEDIAAGLGFTVLKTVIAQDASGRQTMKDWAIRESKMRAERIIGRMSGREGWTISWKGRGWWLSFDEYLTLVRATVETGRRHDLLVVPSCKFHLPLPNESTWNVAEYEYTLRRLAQAYTENRPEAPLLLEVDFSPTLAGSERATDRSTILHWLHSVPALVRRWCPIPVRVGLKLFNALFEDEFQVEMLRHTLGADAEHRPDFLTYANRLYDPEREFEGKRGIAYGGPDLSDRNLKALDLYWLAVHEGRAPVPTVPISATGDIHSGRMALEYALRGAETFQIHTFFQLPAEVYAMQTGSKVAKAVHRLYFHPDDGLIAWLYHVGRALGRVGAGGAVRLADILPPRS